MYICILQQTFHFTRTYEDSVQAVHSAILSFSHIMMFRDKIDGSLRGMMSLGFVRSKEHTMIKLGLAMFDNFYKGGPYAYLAVLYFILKG